MGRVRRSCALVLALGLLGCSPTLSPPGRADLSGGLRLAPRAPPPDPSLPRRAGEAPPSADTAGATLFRLSAGAHLASAFPHRVLPIDAGFGYVFTDVALGERKVHGMYGEFTPLAWAGEVTRLYVGVRGEVLFPDREGQKKGFTALGRVAIEGVNPVRVVGDDHKTLVLGGAYGVYGFGAFAEAGGHKLPGGEQAYLVLGGVSVRFPASAGFLMFVK